MKDKNNLIPLFYPYIPKEKILKEIEDTLNSRWLGQGPKVDKFEKMLRSLTMVFLTSSILSSA